MSQTLAAARPVNATIVFARPADSFRSTELSSSQFARCEARSGIEVDRSSGAITCRLNDFPLSNGAILREARVSFCVFASRDGAPVSITNAADLRALIAERGDHIKVVHPALSGNSQMLPPAGRDASQGAGWGQHWIKSFLNTERDLVFCLDHFGGHNPNPETGTTSARELQAQGHMGAVRFSDGIRAAALAFRSLGMSEIHAAIGGSIGGNQAMEWLRQDILPVKNIVDISGSAAQNGVARDFFAIQRDLLSDTPDYGRLRSELYTNLRSLLNSERESTAGPKISSDRGSVSAFERLYHAVDGELQGFDAHTPLVQRLECARRIGFLKFVPPAFYAEKLERYQSSAHPDTAESKLLGWFDRQGKEFSGRFGAEGLRELCNMNVQATRWTPQALADLLVARGTNLQAYYVIGDTLFPGEAQRVFYQEVRERLGNEDRDARRLFTLEVNDPFSGHDNFLTERFALSGARILRQQLYQGKDA